MDVHFTSRVQISGNDNTECYICTSMGKAGLNLSKYQKKYRPLGRWNILVSMNGPLLTVFFSLGKSIKSGLFIES
jgi:hypothetical protein